MSFRAGHHRIYYAPNAGSGGGATYLGDTEQGIRWGTNIHRQHIRSDRGGQARVNGIEMGQDITLSCIGIEYDLLKAAAKSLTPSAAAYASLKAYANVGKLTSSKAGPLYAVPVAGTPAETELGAGKCYVFYLAILANNLDDLLSSRLRVVNLTFECYPDAANDDKYWEEITTPGGFETTPGN